MQRLLLTYLSQRGLKLSSSKTFVNSKVIFILNDQIERFLRTQTESNLVDFIFSNASKNQGGNLTKTSDFFSRLLKCLFSMRSQVPEMEILLGLLITGIGEDLMTQMISKLNQTPSQSKGSGIRRKNTITEVQNNEDLLRRLCRSNSRRICRNYSILRKQILELKGLEPNAKHMLSTVELRDSEIKDLLKFYRVSSKDLSHFLKQHFPQVMAACKVSFQQRRSREPSFVKVKGDCLLLFFVFHSSVKTLRSAEFAPPDPKNKSVRTVSTEKKKFSRIVFRTKVRRGLFKLRIVALFLVGLRRRQYAKDIKWFKAKIDTAQKKLREKVYFKEETMGNVKEVLVKFGGMVRKTGLVQYEHARIVKAVKGGWETFHEWVRNMVGIGPREVQEHQKSESNQRES